MTKNKETQSRNLFLSVESPSNLEYDGSVMIATNQDTGDVVIYFPTEEEVVNMVKMIQEVLEGGNGGKVGNQALVYPRSFQERDVVIKLEDGEDLVSVTLDQKDARQLVNLLEGRDANTSARQEVINNFQKMVESIREDAGNGVVEEFSRSAEAGVKNCAIGILPELEAVLAQFQKMEEQQ